MVVPKGFKVCNGGCGKVLEENGDNFPLSRKSKRGFSNICKLCFDARYGKKDVPDGHHRCTGECGKVLKLSAENFARSKTRSGFQHKCKSCYNAETKAKKDAVRGDKPKQQRRERPKEDLPDGHQRCLGECSRVLEMSAENFHRNKSKRSGFQATCKMCNYAKAKAWKAAKKRARVEPEHVVELPQLDELPGYDDDDDDEEVISD